MLGHSALGEQPLGAFDSTITYLAAANGTFTLTGQDVLFDTFSGYTMAGGTGAFTLTGQAAGLIKSLNLVSGVGAFTLTGINADFIRHTLAGEAGAFTLTGQAASLLRSYPLTATTGAFTLSGQNAALRLTLTRFEVDAAAFTLTISPVRATHHYTINKNVTDRGFVFALDDTLTAGERR